MSPHGGRLASVVVAGALAATTLGACTSGHEGATHLPGSYGRQAGATDVIATRWWSTPASTKGSVIDYSAPTAVAHRLHASRTGYCEVLRQTVAAGKSVLAGASATDPAVLVSTRAFVAETSALAPKALKPSWKVFGSTLVKVAASGGDLRTVKGVDARATAHATAVIAKDSQLNCHVSLGRTTRVK